MSGYEDRASCISQYFSANLARDAHDDEPSNAR
jgi:hypothetical protein